MTTDIVFVCLLAVGVLFVLGSLVLMFYQRTHKEMPVTETSLINSSFNKEGEYIKMKRDEAIKKFGDKLLLNNPNRQVNWGNYVR